MSLRVGGFQKNTLIDFPGVVASLVFTQGCNFRCPYCHNPSLIPLYPHKTDSNKSNQIDPAYLQTNDYIDLIDPSEVFEFLKKRKGLIDGVTITGGEPTLQPQLASFCFRLKNMGLKVKVDTNGSRPDVVEQLLKRELVDFVAMDIKSNKAGYQQIAQNFNFLLILKSIKIIIKRSPAYEFRTTCVKPFISKEIMHQIGEMIKGASSYVLQHCSKNVEMLNLNFFQNFNVNNLPDFDDSFPFFSDDEFIELKSIAEKYVQNCSIR
ncbi:MAG: anaerobic ribonucleoside-triphosphate reductase activating protein [Desulfamplus sp.]|nr:anaerobic ribonucleoside-triphosphate reductase activating protein [Desulfamplus sp.]